MSNTVVLEPISRTGLASRIVWRPLDSLQGKVVGFIDNSKPNFSFLADDLAELMQSRHGVAQVLRHRKRAASVPAAEDVLDAFARDCDLVIAGSGD